MKNEQEEDKQREIFSRQMQDLESHIAEVERLYRDMRSLRLRAWQAVTR